MKTLILSGSGRYGDPWHPFPATSRRIAMLLGDAGHGVDVREDVDRALASAPEYDLVVVNAGDPWGDHDDVAPPEPAAQQGLSDALSEGVGFLSMHISVASLRQYPSWAEATGAIWVPGASFHPELGTARVSLDRDALPGAPDDFDVVDERYCRLQFIGDRTVVARHEGEHGPEPTAWLRNVGPARIAVDVLGHDERSYDSPGHRALLLALATWASRR